MYFINELKKDEYNQLTKEEEQNLIKLAQNGDIKAKNKIIKANLRTVVKKANYYSKKIFFINKNWMTAEDLFQEGVTGLDTAIKRYNFKKNNDIKFINYAMFHIKNSMLRFAQNNIYTVKQSQQDRNTKLFENMQQPIDDFENNNEFVLTHDNLKTFQKNIDNSNELDYFLRRLTKNEYKLITEYYGYKTKQKSIKELSKEIKSVRYKINNIIKKMRTKILTNKIMF